MGDAPVTEFVSRLAPVGSTARSVLADAGSTSGADVMRAWLSAERVLFAAVELGLVVPNPRLEEQR